jgi:hypothetical protein
LRARAEGGFKTPVPAGSPLPPHGDLTPRPALLTGVLTRRRLLAATGVGGLALVVGTWLYRHVWKLGPPGHGLACLSDAELVTVAAIAEAFFPGPPDVPLAAGDVKLAEFADGFIGGQYEDTQRLFRVLFLAVEQWPRWGRGRVFSALPLAERKAVLASFRDSDLMVRRAAYQSMRYLFSLGYFEDLRVRRAAKLRFGCDLSSHFPELSGQGGALG